MELKDRVAIVTGATRGLGRAIALELDQAGAQVVINYRKNGEAVRAAVSTLPSAVHLQQRHGIARAA